ncbi:dienelactone hydrolase [Haematococcus lacustris]
MTTGSVVPVTFGESKLPGFEMGDTSLPALIVIQEWWGVTDTIKTQAALLAAQGFRVLIPDLYKGKIGVNAEEASHMMGNLDFGNAVKEIGEAAAYLKDTGSPKVGITGFCMGGALTFAAAQHVPLLVAAAPCYGIPDARYFQVESIKIPLLGTFGGRDTHTGFADPAAASAVEQKIKAAGGNIDMRIFPSAPHGFLNQITGSEGIERVKKLNKGVTADEEDLQAAWSRLIAFFKLHLQS